MRYSARAPSVIEVAVQPDSLDRLSWPDLFGNDHPVELEIGTGKAGYLLRRAKQLPDRNFFGIEWASKFYRYAVDRMERWRMPNVRMTRTDAAHFIRVQCPRNSLTVLHIYHPDPWPKTRHHRRRLIQAPFVAAAAECLITGGQLRVQTDHAEYFEQIQHELRASPAFTEIDFADEDFGVIDDAIETNFEIKYRREGREFHRIAVVKH